MKNNLVRLTCLFVALMTPGCASSPVTGDSLGEMTGKIVYVDLEGGFYGIKTHENERYEPVNLPREFRHAGIPVRFTARACRDCMSIRMWGLPVHVLKIEKLSRER